MKIRTKGMISKGDKVLMNNGEILTVKGLEFSEFTAVEKSEYIPKKDIKGIIIPNTNTKGTEDNE